MKEPVGTLNAVPSKRLFLSIIADYDLNKSICELVDNAFDVWTRAGREGEIQIDVWLNSDQQTIRVEDSAGGLPREDLSYIVGPGQSGSASTDETIGIFGVGTKRAVVALAQDIRIRTRFGDEATYQVEFDDAWLNDPDWRLQLYRVDEIPPGATHVELQKLRVVLTLESEQQLRTHLGATYARFIDMNGVRLRLNGTAVEPRVFDQWSYPPGYEPRRYHGQLKTPKDRLIEVEVLAGLSNESSPATGEYGVYFYCNDRLVAPAMKSFDVGFTRGQAGLPHPKVSLTKVIVSLRGDAGEMPWNSSKSDISTKHHTFIALHDWLVEVVKQYAALSRIWMGDWPEKVFRYESGDIVQVDIEDFITARKAFLPDLPKSRPRYGDRVASANQELSRTKPYVKGLYEGVVAAVSISKLPLTQKNWLAFAMLDLTLTSAFKEYLANETNEELSDHDLKRLLERNSGTTDALPALVPLPAIMWEKVNRFSRMKTNLLYSKGSPSVSDSDFAEFSLLVDEILAHLFQLELLV